MITNKDIMRDVNNAIQFHKAINNNLERADFERKERKENLTAEQEDSLEIMSEDETEAYEQYQSDQSKHQEL